MVVEHVNFSLIVVKVENRYNKLLYYLDIDHMREEYLEPSLKRARRVNSSITML